jgi:hypothetical protein
VNKDSVLFKILDMQDLPNTKQGRKQLESDMTRLVDFFQPILSKAALKALKEMKLIKTEQRHNEKERTSPKNV